MKRFFPALALILILLIIIFHYPKIQSSNTQDGFFDCNCFGFSLTKDRSNKICFGIPFQCSSESMHEWSIRKDNNFCEEKECRYVREYLGLDFDSKSSVKEEYRRTNLILIIDTSLSMRGDRIAETKKSAIEFVKELNQNDLSSVITFNTKSEIIHGFSNDKESVISAIQNISVEEDTRYLPAFGLAEKEFSKLTGSQYDNDRKIIIFLSDGDPLDDSVQILNYAEKFKGQGIEIFTIRFGFEVRTDILEQIATETPEGVKGYYVSEDIESLYTSFKKIYESFQEKESIFHVASEVNKTLYYDDDEFIFSYKIFSNENKYLIPGYVFNDALTEKNNILSKSIGKDQLCVKKADSFLIIEGDSKSYEVPLKYSLSSYVGRIDSLPLGKYNLFMNISISYGSDCSFDDYVELGAIEVIKRSDGGFLVEKESNSFGLVDCEILKDATNDIDAVDEITFEPQYRVLVAIDSSESITHNNLISSRYGLLFFLDLFLPDSNIGIIDFNQEAKLIQPFTRNKDLLMRNILNLSAGGSTAFNPVFNKANSLFSYYNDSMENIFIFISDGFLWDEESYKIIIDNVDKLTSSGVCIYSIGLGNNQLYDKNAQKILRDIASRNLGKCGGYRHAFPEELPAVFRSIYKDIHNIEDELDIFFELNSQRFESGEPLIIKANVYSKINKVEFPSYYYRGLESYHLLPAYINVTIQKEGVIVYKGNMDYYDGFGYSSIISSLNHGKYDLTFEAELMVNGQSCNMTGKNGFSVLYLDSEDSESKKKSFLLGVIIIDLLSIIIIIIVIKKYTQF